jgi:hypothetical protein
MKFGVIGSGNIGGTMVRRLRSAGHEVTVANSRGPKTLATLAKETGAQAGTVQNAVRDSDLVVLAVPLAAVPELPRDAFRDKVVIDADNYYPQRDGDIAEISGKEVSSSRWTANQLPGARVVKAFNSIEAEHLAEAGSATNGAGAIALPVAGDDPKAKQVVMGVAQQLGFDTVDAGSLDESWRQEPGTPVYLTDLDQAGVARGLATAHR